MCISELKADLWKQTKCLVSAKELQAGPNRRTFLPWLWLGSQVEDLFPAVLVRLRT